MLSWRKISLISILWAISAPVQAANCPTSCTANSDCAPCGPGNICTAGSCAPAPCNINSDCTSVGTNLICNAGVCTTNICPGVCAVNSDCTACGASFNCVSGACIYQPCPPINVYDCANDLGRCCQSINATDSPNATSCSSGSAAAGTYAACEVCHNATDANCTSTGINTNACYNCANGQVNCCTNSDCAGCTALTNQDYQCNEMGICAPCTIGNAGAFCASDLACCGANVCLGNTGSGGTCGTCITPGLSCTTNDDCCEGVCSPAGVCALISGPCQAANECLSNNCTGGSCGCNPAANPCEQNSDCCSGLTCTNYVCNTCAPLGSLCTQDSDCCFTDIEDALTISAIGCNNG
ncbi:MAG TPA: hypothetical protein VJJ83_02215, partial [Candidatus Babeliales bacterium]|nr:hypothetical protein [Candidatus Babeliales bacterium]